MQSLQETQRLTHSCKAEANLSRADLLAFLGLLHSCRSLPPGILSELNLPFDICNSSLLRAQAVGYCTLRVLSHLQIGLFSMALSFLFKMRIHAGTRQQACT